MLSSFMWKYYTITVNNIVNGHSLIYITIQPEKVSTCIVNGIIKTQIMA